MLLYGSCVSRDTYELVKNERDLLGYVARQSLISAMSVPAAAPTLDALESPFQRRMVTEDFEGSLKEIVRSASRHAAVFLIDLVDERLGVHRLSKESYVTRSNEFVKAGLHTHFAEAEWVRFGTTPHLELYRNAVADFADLLRVLGLADRTLVIEAPFAADLEDGSPCPLHGGRTAEEWNRLYRPYFDLWEHHGVAVHRVPADRVAASVNHRWGVGPYHYVESTYRAVLEEVTARGL